MLYWGKLICWILLLRRTVSCSAASRFKIFVWPVTIWAQTLQNISTNNEESGYSKRKAFSNICDSQPTSVMLDEGSSSTTTTTFGWSSSHKVVRRFAAWANDWRWTVGLLAVSWTSWRTLRSSASHERRETRFAAENWPVCHDTRRNRLCGHGGYCGTTPQFHASRVDSMRF